MMGDMNFAPIITMGVFFCLFVEYFIKEENEMKRKNLADYRFVGGRGKECRILRGYEGAEALYEECGENEPLYFCCDAKIVKGRLKGSYCVSYTVTKEEFFDEIEALSEERKKNADSIAATLRKKYYKIPTVFLKLVGEAYLGGEKSYE